MKRGVDWDEECCELGKVEWIGKKSEMNLGKCSGLD